MEKNDTLITLTSAYRLLKCTRQNMYYWIVSDNPPPMQFIDGKRFFPKAALVKWYKTRSED